MRRLLLLSLVCVSACDSAWSSAEVSPANISHRIYDGYNQGGVLLQRSADVWEMRLRDDNDNGALPLHWRGWWRARLDGVSTTTPTEIDITGLGWRYFYTPFYSYDGTHWQPFDGEVEQPNDSTLRVRHRFDAPSVFIARFVPYTYLDLQNFIRSIAAHPLLRLETLGESPDGYDVPFLTIADPNAAPKARAWVHARTHPGEVGASFLVEGLVSWLLGDSPEAATVRSRYIFHIVPMHNVDGVEAGNYRTNTRSENLEVLWLHDAANPGPLRAATPREVALLHDKILELNATPPHFALALNIHATHSDAAEEPFGVAHFGPASAGYDPAEWRLWENQRRLADGIIEAYPSHRFAPLSVDGGRRFLSLGFPETWWWNNYQADVTAMTIETVLSRVGAQGWVLPDDLRALGSAIGAASRNIQ